MATNFDGDAMTGVNAPHNASFERSWHECSIKLSVILSLQQSEMPPSVFTFYLRRCYQPQMNIAETQEDNIGQGIDDEVVCS